MFSHLAIMVLDANFINIPTRQLAGFLFFILLHKEDATKTDDSVMKVRGCIIDVHEDINNLPSLTKQPLVVVHHIVIVLQCLIISWEKLIIDKIIQPKVMKACSTSGHWSYCKGFSPVCLSLWFLSSLAERLLS